MNYTVARYVRYAYTALKRTQKHIINADAEAHVSGNPARQELRRCRELAEVLQGLLLDAKFHVEQSERPKTRRITMRQNIPLRRLRKLAAIEDQSLVSVGGLLEDIKKLERHAKKAAQKKGRSQP